MTDEHDHARPVRAALTGETPQDLSWVDASKWAGSIDMSRQLYDQLSEAGAGFTAGDDFGVWDELVAERHRAHLKHGPTSMESCDRFADRRLRIITEELGEVARVLNDREHDMQPGKPQQWYDDAEDHHLVELRGELVQLAAMAVAWIAALDGEALA